MHLKLTKIAIDLLHASVIPQMQIPHKNPATDVRDRNPHCYVTQSVQKLIWISVSRVLLSFLNRLIG